MERTTTNGLLRGILRGVVVSLLVMGSLAVTLSSAHAATGWVWLGQGFWGYDRDRNGRIDLVCVDKNRDSHCEVRMYDRDRDRHFESVFIDADRDGRYEVVVYDTNRDGRFKSGRMDLNRNGRYETVFYPHKSGHWLFVDIDENGRYERELYDGNGDGFYEWVKLDTNRDGIADTWTPGTSTSSTSGGPLVDTIRNNIANTTVLNGINLHQQLIGR